MKFKSLKLSGYKSIHPDGQNIELGDITVFLGANGSGKSNLISFFKMLNYMTSGNLQLFVGEEGHASSLLYYGPKRTSKMEVSLELEGNHAAYVYTFVLSYAPGETLIFADESITWEGGTGYGAGTVDLGAGYKETALLNETRKRDPANCALLNFLMNCRVFHFHDTSSMAKIRNQSYIEDHQYLRSDSGNLASVLYALKTNDKWIKYYDRIVQRIHVIMPNFSGFDLSPSLFSNYLLLNWREKESDYLFGPHQISDGALRFMALTALLLQPPELMPDVIILDEPELGLHPLAISSLGGMLKTASRFAQIVLATQSTRLIDEFEAHQIVVVERDEEHSCSIFKKLSEDTLAMWMEKYCLSELWEKNVIGGRP